MKTSYNTAQSTSDEEILCHYFALIIHDIIGGAIIEIIQIAKVCKKLLTNYLHCCIILLAVNRCKAM